MLEVMNASSAQLPRNGRDNAILLNCWEKSSPLIKELERTVNFAERKCGDLMQQLHFYRKYYEKWAHAERLNQLYEKRKVKKCCRRTHDIDSSSENEFEKFNQYFYKRIQNKITEMNNEITQANKKLTSKKEYSPRISPPKETLNKYSTPEEKISIDNTTSKSEPTMTVTKPEEQLVCDNGQSNFQISIKKSSKSVPGRNKVSRKRDSVANKRRFSNLQRYKIRSKSLPQGVRRKFGFGGFFEIFEPDYKRNKNDERFKSKTSLRAESCKSNGKPKSRSGDIALRSRRSGLKSSRSLQNRSSKSKSDLRASYNGYSKANSRYELSVSKNTSGVTQQKNFTLTGDKANPGNICKTIVHCSSFKAPDVDSKSDITIHQNLTHLIAKPNTLVPFLRQPIPFIPCSSTSKTFNLGLNIQQVLSLIKTKRHSVTLQTVVKNGIQAARTLTDKPEPTLNTLFFSQTTTTSHSHVASAVCPAREGSEDGISILTDSIGCRSKCSILKQVQSIRSNSADKKSVDGSVNFDGSLKEEHVTFNKLERPEDVWVVEQPDSFSPDNRKIRTKCTCFPSKHCVDYQKVLRQYTGWRTTHYHPMAACAKSKLMAIPSAENVEFCRQENDGRLELVKVHNDLINLNRKYSFLQEQISQNNLDDCEANAELDAMESELAVREVEFKDILNFYNQLMFLKEKLKTLRVRSGQSQSGIQQQNSRRPRKDPLRPTPSMALTKLLRKIQGLQDKIKLIDVP